MELLAGLLASVKLMKGVGGRGESLRGPVTQAGNCLRSWVGQGRVRRTRRTVPSGLQDPVRHQGQRHYGKPDQRGTELGIASPVKGAPRVTGKPLIPEEAASPGIGQCQLSSRQRWQIKGLCVSNIGPTDMPTSLQETAKP